MFISGRFLLRLILFLFEALKLAKGWCSHCEGWRTLERNNWRTEANEWNIPSLTAFPTQKTRAKNFPNNCDLGWIGRKPFSVSEQLFGSQWGNVFSMNFSGVWVIYCDYMRMQVCKWNFFSAVSLLSGFSVSELDERAKENDWMNRHARHFHKAWCADKQSLGKLK